MERILGEPSTSRSISIEVTQKNLNGISGQTLLADFNLQITRNLQRFIGFMSLPETADRFFSCSSSRLSRLLLYLLYGRIFNDFTEAQASCKTLQQYGKYICFYSSYYKQIWNKSFERSKHYIIENFTYS